MIFDYVISSALREKQLDKEHWDAVVFIKDYLGMHRTLPTKTAVEGFMKRPLKETTDAAGHWLGEVQKNYKRQLAETATMDAAKNPLKALQIMQDAVLAAALAEEDSRIEAFEDRAEDRFKDYRKNKGATAIRYLGTGFEHMDEVTFGYWPSDFWIFGSPEGMGKTWLLTRMAICLDKYLVSQDPDGRPILLINTEVDDEEQMERMDAQRYGLPYGQMLSGTLAAGDERRWMRAARALRSRIRVINDCYTMDDLERYISLTDPVAVYVDSVHLLVEDFEWQDIAKLGQRAKRLAKRYRCPIIANTHLKGGEGKDSTGSTESFAYGKGFTRNASVAALLFQDDQMELAGEIGVKFVKVRRGQKKTLVYRHDWGRMYYDYVGTLGAPGTIYEENDKEEPNLW